MAYETITQILAPTNAPYINGINGERRISAAILENFYQGLVEKNNKGVDDNYVSESDAENATQILVHRILPVISDPREQGASKNGASYSENQHYVQTEDVGIDILQVLDDVILIPRASTDRINVDLLAKQIDIWSKRWATIYNGATAASKLLSVYLAKANGENVNEVVFSDLTDGQKVRNEFIAGHELLEEGDPAHGIDIFPQDTQIAVFRVGFRSILKAGAVLTLGGANEVYSILAADGLNNQGKARVEDDGFVGVIDGVEVRIISNESLGHAAKFLGFPVNEFKKDGYFCGYIASSYACARGASTRERTKVVDEPNGQGIRLQPYVKFGAVCWYPLGVVTFVKDEFNPYGDLNTLLDSISSGLSKQVTFKLKSYGSRLTSNLEKVQASIVITAGTGFTTPAVVALDSWGVTDHVKASYYLVTDSEVKTLAEFLAIQKAGTAASEGTVTFGTSTSESALTSGKWLSIITVSDDGTVCLVSKKA